MEKKNEGSLEKMLVNIRDQVEKGKVNVDKREQYDPYRWRYLKQIILFQ